MISAMATQQSYTRLDPYLHFYSCFEVSITLGQYCKVKLIEDTSSHSCVLRDLPKHRVVNFVVRSLIGTLHGIPLIMVS